MCLGTESSNARLCSDQAENNKRLTFHNAMMKTIDHMWREEELALGMWNSSQSNLIIGAGASVSAANSLPVMSHCGRALALLASSQLVTELLGLPVSKVVLLGLVWI